MATLYLKAAGGNWSAAGTWSNTGSGGGDSSGPPTAADNVILEAGSGNLTIDATAVCRSLDCTSGTGNYGGTLTHNSAIGLSIGDGTAGAGSVALKFVAGMTYTRGAASSAINFVSTSGTQQTITSAGKNLGNTTFNGAGGSWIHSDDYSASAASYVLTAGSLDMNGKTFTIGTMSSSNSNTRSLTMGAADVTVQQFPNAVVFTTITNLTFSGASSTMRLNATGNQTFGSGGLTWGTVILSGSSGNTKGITGAGTFGTLTLTGSASKLDAVTLGANITVTNFNLNGNSSVNRYLISSDTPGTARTITSTTNSITNADLKDITGAGAASWDLSAITGLSGDCGGNSGITFTTGATQYWFQNTGNWSDSSKWFLATNGGGGAGRVPLPQDDVRLDANSFNTGTRVVTQDMPRAGRSIDWTGVTNTPQWTMNTVASIFGSLTLVSGMTMANTSGYTFEGRGSFTLTTAGFTLNRTITLSAPGGTMTQLDAFTSSTSLSCLAGTWTTGNFSITAAQWISNGTLTRTVNFGSSTVTITGNASNVLQHTSTGITLNAGTSNIIFTGTLGAGSTFAGAGLTYFGVAHNGTGTLSITGANTFKTLSGAAGVTIKLVSAVTQTISRFIGMGASGSLVSLISSTGGSAATIAQAGGVTAGDWLSIQDITFSGSSNAKFYAGQNSTNVSGNTGITFAQLTAMNMTTMGPK